ALEDGVRLEMNLHIKVAGGAAVHAGFAFAREADAVAFVHAGGDLHRQRLMGLDAPRAAATGTRVGDVRARAVTARTRLLDRKEALLHPDLTVSVAGRAGLGLRAGLGTAAMAGVALFGGRNADFGLRPMRRLFERDFQVVAQVCAAINGRAAACAPAAEDVAEDVAE